MFSLGKPVPRILFGLVAVLSFFVVVAGPVAAQALGLAAIFSDHMVLQRGMPVPVYGRGESGARVLVQLGSTQAETTVDASGAWRVAFPAMAAGGPYELHVTSGDEHITHENVMVGDVWICSGQSNMAWPVNTGVLGVRDAEAETASANWPDLRLMTVGAQSSDTEQPDIETLGWRVCTPETVGAFSATGYFFGRDLHRHLGVPVGLIYSAVGGTIIEAWTSPEGLEAVPEMAALMDEFRANKTAMEQIARAFDAEFEAWQQSIYAKDPGYSGSRAVWAEPDFDASGWPVMALPAYWEEAGYPGYDGTMWFRREVALPEAMAGQPLRLRLAAVNDRARVWFNGEQIVDWAGNAHAEAGFRVPGHLVVAGKNTIVVRLYDMGGNGGIYGSPKDLWLRVDGVDAPDSISLVGDWQVQPGFETPPDFPKLPRPPAVHPENPNMPARLYHGMIAPLTRTPIRGAIWYQGEGNTKRSHQYRSLFPALIRDWRKQWGQGDFPFLFVQLANYKTATPEHDLGWAELREAQSMALALPNTGMAVTIDIGEADDVHPRNKQDVGRRLALAARHIAYGEDLVYSGPAYVRHSVEKGTIRVRFEHTGGGMKTAGGTAPAGFQIAGADQMFHTAAARIEGDEIVVWSETVPAPVAVRYGWDGNPACNLYNAEGLPASPFRTDTWPGVTEGNILTLPAVDAE